MNKIHYDVDTKNSGAGQASAGAPPVAVDEFYRHPSYRAENAEVAALDRLWGASLLLGEQMRSGLAERGITLARAAVLSLLERAGASTQRSLSRVLSVTPRNVTGLVDALEGEGLVVRRPHPSDRRATLVTLTERGAALAARLKSEQDAYAERLFGDVDAAELRTFLAVMDRVLARVQASLGPPR